MSYADLLLYLLNNAMVAMSLTKIPQPPFSRGYNSNVTCAYHGGVLGHSIEHCMTLKHKVQSLIDAGKLRFEENNHLWILTSSRDTMHDAWGNLKVVAGYFQGLVRIFRFMLLLKSRVIMLIIWMNLMSLCLILSQLHLCIFIQLSLKCECTSLVCLLKWHVILS